MGSCQTCKIVGCAWAGNAGNDFPAIDFLRRSLVSDPGMHHSTCVTHVPWCMSRSLTRGSGKNVPGIPGACATRNFTFTSGKRSMDTPLHYGPFVMGVHRWLSEGASQIDLSHWGRVMHICVGKLTITGSDNGLSPGSDVAKQLSEPVLGYCSSDS